MSASSGGRLGLLDQFRCVCSVRLEPDVGHPPEGGHDTQSKHAAEGRASCEEGRV